MIKVIVRLKDKNKISELEKYGAIIYKSPVLNIVALEIEEGILNILINDQNVLSCDVESEGRLMYA
ncbi:hypothetical protein P5750_08675 [Bacillus cereus]|uniref:hypothetical protein n=1 Tax=Bacillus cereus TaxID=1396 RepID=UPI0024067411|nr:hypothetical protein [Bacillus cereus]MDF9540334.1 hypothetical protein [Bacillus cereus]MDF9583457.1 hypothetical protein [Bacillus cereus]MDF9583525.1 hypothetical protein [Bacillus cereus]MDG1590350.1 hypothetical protein [Bacillus cereus]